MEVLGCRGVHGNGDRLQAHTQGLPHCCLDLPAQALQPPVDAQEHGTLPLIGCRLHILPEVPHLHSTFTVPFRVLFRVPAQQRLPGQ